MSIKEIILKDLEGKLLSEEEVKTLEEFQEALEYVSGDDYYYDSLAVEQNKI